MKIKKIIIWIIYIFIMVNTPLLKIMHLGKIAFSSTFLIQWILIISLFDLYYILPLFFLLIVPDFSYYSYNLIAVILSINLFNIGLRKGLNIIPEKLLYFNKYFFLITILLGFSQWFLRDIWNNIIPFQIIPYFRGSAFQIEPSFLAFPLLIYISFQLVLFEKNKKNKLIYETIIVSMLTIIMTKSISVFLISIFSFSLIKKLSLKQFFIIMFFIVIVFIILTINFYPRLEKIFDIFPNLKSYKFIEILLLISKYTNSWRNVPDIIIFSNAKYFLFPGSPYNIRYKISVLGEEYGYGWLEATFNIFSSAIIIFGFLGIMYIFFFLILMNYRIFDKIIINNRLFFIIYGILIVTFYIPKGAVFSWFLLGGIFKTNRLKNFSNEKIKLIIKNV
ncbi:hypothetical protein LN42_06495 [Marinitoga sp. 1137]|uniref:hypothetical protein n=1 Tax=Marinitoga sp. 1137 TaxID=1545835 RepID=UPI0009504F9D|nr:hypothetical protein [Marinitoga sp. 1137]APT76068.1 hypothetical protein LN42_06495 [Marinitoga sp. 1137]